MIEKRPVVGWIGDYSSGGLTLYPDLGHGLETRGGIDLGHGIPTEQAREFRVELEALLDRIVQAQRQYGSAGWSNDDPETRVREIADDIAAPVAALGDGCAADRKEGI